MHTVYFQPTLFPELTKPLAVQASIIWCLSQARIDLDGCDGKGIWRKNGWMMEVGTLIVWTG